MVLQVPVTISYSLLQSYIPLYKFTSLFFHFLVNGHGLFSVLGFDE